MVAAEASGKPDTATAASLPKTVADLEHALRTPDLVIPDSSKNQSHAPVSLARFEAVARHPVDVFASKRRRPACGNFLDMRLRPTDLSAVYLR